MLCIACGLTSPLYHSSRFALEFGSASHYELGHVTCFSNGIEQK